MHLQAEQIPDTYEAEGADALDKTSTPPGSPQGCSSDPKPERCLTVTAADPSLACLDSTHACYPRDPSSASSDGEKDDSVGAMLTGSMFDQTLSEDRDGGKQWGGGGSGSFRGRGRARGTLEPGEDSADELEDEGDSHDQDDAETEPEDGQTRRFLYLKVRHLAVSRHFCRSVTTVQGCGLLSCM